MPDMILLPNRLVLRNTNPVGCDRYPHPRLRASMSSLLMLDYYFFHTFFCLLLGLLVVKYKLRN